MRTKISLAPFVCVRIYSFGDVKIGNKFYFILETNRFSAEYYSDAVYNGEILLNRTMRTIAIRVSGF